MKQRTEQEILEVIEKLKENKTFSITYVNIGKEMGLTKQRVKQIMDSFNMDLKEISFNNKKEIITNAYKKASRAKGYQSKSDFYQEIANEAGLNKYSVYPLLVKCELV